MKRQNGDDVHKIVVIYGEAESSWIVDQVLAPAVYNVVAIPYVSATIAKVFSPTKPDFVILLDIGLAGEPVQDLCRQIRKESEKVPLFVLGFWGTGRPDPHAGSWGR
jgi:DNA-binding response OmpR family regulator